jgi:hypothetical protein
MHQSFDNVRDLDDKILGFTDNSIFSCIHVLSVYRVRIHEGIRGLAVYRVSMYAG